MKKQELITDRKDLDRIEITTNSLGFTVWITEDVAGVTKKHWVIDGSMVKEDGEIRISNHPLYEFGAKYNRDTSSIQIIKKHVK